MISLDTNLILSALNTADSNHLRAINAVDMYNNQTFCICPIVKTELRAAGSWVLIDAWMNTQGIVVIWQMPEIVWDSAGIAFGAYAKMRRSGVVARRMGADFLIAAHAEHHHLEVLTFDDTVFKSVFPEVTLLAC